MNKYAVIDIGSNSVRLMLLADGKVLYKALNTTRLGEGIADKPILKEEAIQRTAFAVEQFYKQAVLENAQKIYAFATAAVRTAENGQTFTNRVKSLCGLDVEVVSGETEAELGITGALGNNDGGIIDIGGASTEIVVKKAGKILFKKSINIGVVRLKDKCGREKEALRTLSEQEAKTFGNIPNEVPMYAIGGTATTLAALVLGLEKYDSQIVTGTAISLEQMQEWSDKLLSMSVEEIEKFPCMPKGRADVLAGGAVLLSVLMKTHGFDKVIVSDRDNLEGYAIKKGLM